MTGDFISSLMFFHSYLYLQNILNEKLNDQLAFQFEMQIIKIQHCIYIEHMNYFTSEHSVQSAILVNLFSTLASK